MVIVAQLVRAPVCGSGGRGFESRLLPYSFEASPFGLAFFIGNYGISRVQNVT